MIQSFCTLRTYITGQRTARPLVLGMMGLNRQAAGDCGTAEIRNSPSQSLIASAACFLVATSLTLCEEKSTTTSDSLTAQSSASAEPVEKYENVPEEDEETDCFLCRTHRQGPCRDVWRNFEYCIKDHRDTGDTSQCDRFVKPFEKCWMEHIQLYLLIALDANKRDLDRIHGALRYQRPIIFEPAMDWMPWMDFCESENFGIAVKDAYEWSSIDKSVPYWKRFEFLKLEPTIVNIASILPVVNDDGLKLKTAYAVDQDGIILGYAEYDEAYEAKKAADENRSVPDNHKLIVSLVPGMTNAIRVVAVYRKSDEGLSGQGKLRVYETLPIALPIPESTAEI